MSVRRREWTTGAGATREAWIVDYADASGVRRLKTFLRKKDADQWAAATQVNVRAGIHTSSRMTVSAAGAKWLEDAAADLEPTTIESYRQHLESHIKPFIGTVRLSDLTVPMIHEFAGKLRAEGRSPSMVKRVIGDLGSIVADAQERGDVAQNVVRSLSRRKQRGHKVARRHKKRLKVGEDIPSPEEIRAIVAQLKGRWRPLLLTAIFTGLRASELRGLKWSDVDLKKSELHVRQRADRFNKIGTPKSADAQRTIPMPPVLVSALREWKLACPRGELGLVFPNGAGRPENHRNIARRGLAPTQIAAGVVTKGGQAKYPGLHALRHFFASWCINRREDGGMGLPIKTVQARLGHSSIQMTADTYGHLFAGGNDAAELAAAERALLG